MLSSDQPPQSCDTANSATMKLASTATTMEMLTLADQRDDVSIISKSFSGEEMRDM